jgi:hypothetical protein
MRIVRRALGIAEKPCFTASQCLGGPVSKTEGSLISKPVPDGLCESPLTPACRPLCSRPAVDLCRAGHSALCFPVGRRFHQCSRRAAGPRRVQPFGHDRPAISACLPLAWRPNAIFPEGGSSHSAGCPLARASGPCQQRGPACRCDPSVTLGNCSHGPGRPRPVGIPICGSLSSIADDHCAWNAASACRTGASYGLGLARVGRRDRGMNIKLTGPGGRKEL